MNKKDVEELRRQIDLIDDRIMRLLGDRMEVAVRLKKLKQAVFDEGREQEVLGRVKSLSRNLLRKEFSERLYADILSESKYLQERNLKLIGFQGEHGAYSELAARTYEEDLVPIPCTQFEDVFSGVETGKLDLGIVPVENSLEGAVTAVSDLLREKELKIVGALRLPVHHTLLTLPETEERDIKVVFSHPQATGQCRRYLSERRIEPRPFYDTAGSARMLAEERPPSTGAIASRLCADLYHLKVVDERIEDHPSNGTRFAVIAREMTKAPGDRCSIVFTAKHEAGSLFKVLKVFSDRAINLTRIESRPLRTDPGRYSFLVTFEGACDDLNVVRSMEEVRSAAESFKLLGCYREVEV